ncbi:hypothetical protein BJ138DRAFT_1091186 [Hygrophoropsis aurantiaca]|uniref:Uncharacterized protein n=1 Tax=Hygrophoropsis aurantiaca TaxID=72124 RepID=A0ACB8A5Y1_9AGAM|nr:hypothetical protein BJ138DRAFT_1091186 [Hygrophoropsis aurantiaca]
MDCLHDVDKFLRAMPVKVPRIRFSSMEGPDLGNLGIPWKKIIFVPEELDKLAQDFTSQQSAEIRLLRARILDIHEHVNMDFVPRSRMILESIVLTLAKIASDPQSQTNVAIFPEMMLTPDKGVKVTNPESGYQALLYGSVDYAIIQYKDEYQNKAPLRSSRSLAFQIATGCLLLVEERRQLTHDAATALELHIPEAIGQALALATSTNREEVRFCLSNGNLWLFYILKLREGKWWTYDALPQQLEVGRDMSDSSLHVIMKLLLE